MQMRARARAQAFDAALAGAPSGSLAREVALAGALTTTGAALAPAPSAEFRAALRGRLLAVAAVQGIGETARTPAPAAVSWRSRAATVAAGVTAAAVAVTGVSAAASQSLPGDPFYDVKRAAENVQLWLADGPAEEGERHLQFAEERRRELQALALGRDLEGREGAPAPAQVSELLADMDEQTRSATRLLTEAFRTTSDAEPLERLAAFAAAQAEALEQVLPELPTESRPRLRESLALVSDVRTTADELLVLRDCTAECDPAAAAPTAPAEGATADQPCDCPTPVPAPSVAPAPAPSAPSSPAPGPASGSTATPSPAPSGSSSPSPRPSPSTSPTPLVPLPTEPGVPLPTLLPLPDGDVRVPALPDGTLGAVTDALTGVAGALVLGPVALLPRLLD